MEASNFQENWEALKKSVRQHWNKLTEDDIDAIDGSLTDLKNKIAEVYGYHKSKVKQEIDEFLSAQADGSTALGDTIRKTAGKINQYSDALADSSDKMIHQGQATIDQVQKNIEQKFDVVYDYIKNHPVKATLIAAGVGLLIGRIFKR